MAEDDLNEAIRLSLASAKEEERKRKQEADEEKKQNDELKKAIELSAAESPEGKENRHLREELQYLKTKIRILEDASKVDVERSQLRSLFHLFNQNTSGDSIAIPEFSSLLEAVHGASLSREEVVSAMKSIAPANPEVVTFEEFYKWWHSSGLAVPDPALKSLQRLATPSHREMFLRLGRRLLYNKDGLFPSPLNEDTSKIDLKVATAPEFQSMCGVNIHYVNDAKLAETRRKEMKLPATEADNIIASMSLSFVDGVDEFGLGELAGSLKDLLSLAKDEVGYTSYYVNLARENGAKRFRMVLCFAPGPEDDSDDEMVLLMQLLKNMNPKSLNCSVDFSQSFDPAKDDKRAVEARLQLNAELNARFIEWLHVASVENAERKRPKYLPPRNPEEMAEEDLLHFFRLLQMLRVDISLETLTQKWRQSFEDKKGPSRIVFGWREITNVLLRALAPAAENETIPELVWDTYRNSLATFREVANVTIQYQNQMLVADFKDIALFPLFPTVEMLKALPPSEKPGKSPKTRNDYNRPKGVKPPSAYEAYKRGPWDA